MPVLDTFQVEKTKSVDLSVPTEIRDIAYLLATGVISDNEAQTYYQALLRKSHKESLVTRLMRALFPSLVR